MPTGYTAAIKDGITFQQFAMECARGFGACIMMRDQPMNVDIPEFKPSDYHTKRLVELQADLAEARQITRGQAETAALNAFLNAQEGRAKEIRERDDLRLKYEAMLAEVNKWKPPTSEHVGLRDFMKIQILESIRYDCAYTPEPVEQVPGDVWLATKISQLERSIEYHTRMHAEEVQRTADRNAWVKKLRDSLARDDQS